MHLSVLSIYSKYFFLFTIDLASLKITLDLVRQTKIDTKERNERVRKRGVCRRRLHAKTKEQRFPEAQPRTKKPRSPATRNGTGEWSVTPDIRACSRSRIRDSTRKRNKNKTNDEVFHGQTDSTCLNPLMPNINNHILLIILLIFCMSLVGRIWLKIKTFDHWWSFSLFSWPVCLIKWWYCKEKLDACHYWDLKG